MERRNKFLESDGLYWESETHEWFHDKISTQHAQKKSVLWVSGEHEDALKFMCFVVRNKETGEYDRVVMDIKTNEIIYTTKSLEDLGYYIDKLKVIERFK
jgi:RimJ/RimL family protein N-acetyltransferase